MSVSVHKNADNPNQRVDLLRFQYGTTGSADMDAYSLELLKQFVERVIGDNLPAIAEGFRITIPDQTANPGDIEVHNGVAFSRDGHVVNDTEALNLPVTVNLPLASTTYFIEVALKHAAARPDMFPFWNPNKDNGTDPSGDPKLRGKEYWKRVAGQWTVSWEVKTNTTGFTLVTKPGTTYIPLAVLTTDSSPTPQVSAINKTAARGILREDLGTSATIAKLWNTRHFPDAFDSNIGGQALTVTANDRENAWLYLSSSPTPAVAAGARVQDVTSGAAVLLDERSPDQVPLPLLDTGAPLPTSGNADARIRQFRLSELLGWTLLRDPYNAEAAGTHTGRNDVEIHALKMQLDAIAGKLRELSWGGMLDKDTTDPKHDRIGGGLPEMAPPGVTDPRYFHSAGGVAGARSHTVSVGDGVLSMGDFNTDSAGASHGAAIQAAIDYVTSGSAVSGTIYIKRRAAFADINTTALSIPSGHTITIVGDGPESELKATGAVPVFDVVGTLNLVNMYVTRSGAVGEAIEISNATGVLTARDCYINGVLVSGVSSTGCFFDDVHFDAGTSGSGFALDGDFVDSQFNRCTIETKSATTTHRAMRMSSPAANNRFYDCAFKTGVVGAEYMVELSGVVTGTVFQDCIFAPTVGAPNYAVLLGDGSSGTSFERCLATASGLAAGANPTSATLDECTSTFLQDLRGVSITGSTTGKRFLLRRCRFIQATSGGSVVGTGVYITDSDGVTLDDCEFVDCDRGVILDGTEVLNATLHNVRVKSLTASRGHQGISISSASVENLSLLACRVNDLDDVSQATSFGISIASTAAGSKNVTATDCQVNNLGGSGQATSYGFRVEGSLDHVNLTSCSLYVATADTLLEGFSFGTNATFFPAGVVMTGCNVFDLNGDGEINAVHVPRYYGLTISGGNLTDIGESANTTGAARGIYLGDGAVGTDQMRVTVSGVEIRDVQNTGAGVVMGIDAQVGFERMKIANNTIESTDANENMFGIRLVGQTGARTARAVLVTGNIIDSSTAVNTGIKVDLPDATDRMVSVSGNIINNYASRGIDCDNTSNCTIAHNSIYTEVANSTGLWLDNSSGGGAASAIAIAANVIRQAGSAGNAGFCVDIGQNGAVDNVTLSGNVLIANQPNVTTEWAVRLSATCTNIFIDGILKSDNQRGLDATNATSVRLGSMIADGNTKDNLDVTDAMDSALSDQSAGWNNNITSTTGNDNQHLPLRK